MEYTYKSLFNIFIEETSISEKKFVNKIAEKYGVKYEDVPRFFSINLAGIYNNIKSKYKFSYYNKKNFDKEFSMAGNNFLHKRSK